MIQWTDSKGKYAQFPRECELNLQMDLLEKEELIINNISFDIKKNVKDVFTDVNTGVKTYSYHEEKIYICDDETNIFFLFEMPFHEAFAHWVFESAIFLPFVQVFINLQNVKKKYILVNKNNERKYKNLFFNLFDIKDENIYYTDNIDTYTSNISYKNIPKNNICIICRNFCMNQNNITEQCIEKYTFLLEQFYDIIMKDDDNISKEIDHLFLPRSKTENYGPNDWRQYEYHKIYNMLTYKEYVEYDTINTNDFKEQIKLLQKSKNIYTNFGSSFLVNGFFSSNSNIYVINKIETHIRDYIMNRIIVSIIEKKNRIIYM
jgi:hypothetical protein